MLLSIFLKTGVFTLQLRTTDSDSYVAAALRILDLLHISYFGHNLDDYKKGLALDRVQHVLARWHSIVEFFRWSPRSETNANRCTLLEVIVEVLKPLSYLTDALSGEKQVTASAVLPVLQHVKSKLAPDESGGRLAEEIIWNDLEHRYSNPDVFDSFSVHCSHSLSKLLHLFHNNRDNHFAILEGIICNIAHHYAL